MSKTKGPTRRKNYMRVGVAWYDTEEDWAQVRAFASDPDRLEDNYHDWLSMAEKALKDIAAAGVVPEKVALDAETLKEWCRSNEKENDASARAELASRLVFEKYQGRK